ncbi:MAG: mechanosensitive ion channel family protein [Pirellulales bacterium]|nr:mechanosensitive ion channel family protein [Pirellulales bacterium]
MKRTPYSCLCVIVIPVILMGVCPACCPAQTPVQQPAVESPPAEQPAAAEIAAKEAAAESTEAPEKGAKAPPSGASVGEQFSSILAKLDPELLWRKNGIVAWLWLLGYIFAGMVLGKIVSVLLLRVASGKEGVIAKFFSDMAGPANLALVTLGIFVGLHWLTLGESLEEFAAQVIHLLFTLSVFWYAYNLIGMIDPLLRHLSRNSASALDKQVAPLVRRTLRVFLLILTVMYVFKDVFGQDIGAWLAGLGIAGIAVSLAAQDSLKNLFGSITIILDRPFKIGDRIICTGYEGVIEDIGFRSTKVRTGAGHLVSIPNANVVNSPIENISRRPGIRRNLTINLPSNTPAEKLKQAAAIARELLESEEFREPIHPRINGEASAPQVTCGEIVNNNLQLAIAYWYVPAKAAEFNQHTERLTVRILEAFEKAGIPLAPAK